MSLTQNVAAIASLILLAAGTSVQAQRTNGDRTLQGAAGSPRATWEKRLLDAVRPKPFGVHYEIAITESPVPAATREEFVRALSAANQDMRSDRSNSTRAPGSGKFRISWTWKPEVHLSECRFKDVTINVDYSIDVAQLGGALAEDSTARVWWAAEVERGFTRRVEVLKFMRDGAKNMHRRLNTMTSNTCSNLADQANAIARMAAEDIYAQVESTRPLPVVP